jgi:hypothetical protein
MKKYPKTGEVFELTLNPNAPENTPLGIINLPETWKHNGKVVTSKETKLFMLVSIRSWFCLAQARCELEDLYGPTPEGQWIKAFKGAYPVTDFNKSVYIADGSWIHQSGDAYYPCVNQIGELSLRCAKSVTSREWWLVEVKKPTKAPSAK